MVEKKTKAAETPDSEPQEDGGGELLDVAPSNFEFIDRVPSAEEVAALLATLPQWWGVAPKDYVDYVQALPSDKKMKVPERGPGGGTRKVDKYFSVVTLYFSVAGRLQMLREAQELHGWRVDFVPEPNTPSGVPGFIDLGTESGRIVYREYLEISAPVGVPKLLHRADDGSETSVAEWQLLGRRPGMAWVPYAGGSQAKGSNPFEKVETASRGRALAAWGFGVLPGSGVASLEEMLGAATNRQAIAGETGGGERPANGGAVREKPEDLIAQILTMAEEARQIRGESEGWNLQNVRDYVRRVANIDVATVPDQDGMPLELDLSPVKPAALLIVRNGYRERLAKLRDDAEQGN